MEWRDQGALLSVRKHGETSAIIEVFTAEHGRHAGVVRGGVSRKIAPILQPGAQLDLSWRARLEEHIGSFTVEPVKSRAAILSDRAALAGLNAVCALLCFALPEREAHPTLYARTIAMLDLLGQNEAWPVAYLKWELSLLEDMGFGLDLSRCAVTGEREDLAYVSPKSGRAVSAEGAGDWAERLLPLPPELLGVGTGDAANVVEGLHTTGHFLTRWLAHSLGDKPLPEARARLVDRLKRAVT
ncbi:DNA repair protein RecO [Aliiroseovarius subalbicans]|uniref:DNA repair protein RecO n=1 Tax=Aliiroseovarius subalbicans TaxID=2925840 RepID=UPI001F584971|nr:DNA repair protein RecO [Aliiroseovarius subalbicans]MCI2399719.1 DNA repair protein RecO [Aliiroseovarius subalbicans]